jgi:hypothetical protein
MERVKFLRIAVTRRVVVVDQVFLDGQTILLRADDSCTDTFEARRRRLKDGFEQGVITGPDLRERLAKIQVEEDTAKRVAKSQAQSLAAPQIERLIKILVKGAYAYRRMADSSDRLRVIQRLFSAVYYENGQITKFSLRPGLMEDSICEVNPSVPGRVDLATPSAAAPRRTTSAVT